MDTRAGPEIYLIVLDINFFKRYNDRYGHPAGDACLRSFVTVLTSVVCGKKDLVFGYGGKEFGALSQRESKIQAETSLNVSALPFSTRQSSI